MTSFSAAEYAKQACTLRENVFGEIFFDEHLSWVAHFAGKLAALLNANADIVTAAAYLHDLSAIENPTRIPEHASQGAVRVAALLISHGYATILHKRRRTAFGPTRRPFEKVKVLSKRSAFRTRMRWHKSRARHTGSITPFA